MEDDTPAAFDFDLLRELTETDGVPGYEDAVRAVVCRELAAATDEVRTDAMGNVVGTVGGEGDQQAYEVAVAAHRRDRLHGATRHRRGVPPAGRARWVGSTDPPRPAGSRPHA